MPCQSESTLKRGVDESRWTTLTEREPLRTLRDGDGKSYVSLVPFVLLLQRQCRVAFEALSVFQAYQAWLLLRPGIEGLLIVGKWIDDPATAEVWKNRRNNRRAYGNAYSGSALRSESLPMADQIQSVLSKINDDFVHANPEYYERHLEVDAAADPGYLNLRLEHFDDDVLHVAHVLAFLHLVLVKQEGLAKVLSVLFGQSVTLKAETAPFTRRFEENIKQVSSDSEEAARILQELGALRV